jgi:uncharacterized protein YcfJ
MKHALPKVLIAACSLVWLAGAGAQTTDGTAAGVKLSGLCATCGVVTEVKTEKRKGKASGVGAVGGAVAGGVIGNKTTDSTLGTVGGAAVGGLLGNEIEKRVKKRTVWVSSVTMKDGSVKRFDAESDPGWKAGTVVEVTADNHLQRH